MNETLPTWLLNDDLDFIRKVKVKTATKLNTVLGESEYTRHKLCCPVCHASDSIYPRYTTINGMQGSGSDGDYIAFNLQCENCEQDLELRCGKKNGFFMELCKVDMR
jgi:hypothetical protein